MPTEKIESESELLKIAKDNVLMARMDKAEPTGPVLERAEGSLVWDVNGKEYVDFNSGQMCSALGHRHPRIVKAIKDACDKIIHASSGLFNVPELRLAKKLASILVAPLKRSLFLDSGADSNEAAVSIAKRYTGGYEFASPHISLHGLSEGARSVTYAGVWHKGYGPYAPGGYTLMAPYCYRCPIGLKYPTCNIACLDGSFEMLDAQADGRIAAVITEPLFSAGGVVEPPLGWLPRLKKKCEERGTLLILDEAQSGLAKLGTMWAFQRENVVPDILTMSKHFGGGISISAVSTTDEIADKIQRDKFVYLHSHSSDPLACAAALASLEIIIDEDLPAKAQELGAYWRGHLDELAARHEMIGDIRGRGILQGIELVKDRETKEPAFEAGWAIERECLEAGLFFSVRRGGSVLRFVPPWTTSKDQFDRAAGMLDKALGHAADTLRRKR
jgi:2,2-dialkylglycine decarboxylase (pyruvate)